MSECAERAIALPAAVGEPPLRFACRPKWRNWQTRRTQNPLPARACGSSPTFGTRVTARASAEAGSTGGSAAEVAELVDAADSKSVAREGVWVRAPPSASTSAAAMVHPATSVAAIAAWYDLVMRIGILTGGGDVPGLNPCIKAVVNRVAHDGHEVVGLRRGWAGLLQHDLDDPASAARVVPAAHPVDRPDDRPHGRHVPAHLAHEPEPRARRRGARASRRPRERRRPVRLHRPRAPRRRGARDRRADPDRRRRHAVVRAADARRGRARGRDPEDDGQRRPRDRLLHRVLDGGHARRPVHPQPAHVDRLATSGSRSSSCSAATAARRRSSPPTSRASTAR